MSVLNLETENNFLLLHYYYYTPYLYSTLFINYIMFKNTNKRKMTWNNIY